MSAGTSAGRHWGAVVVVVAAVVVVDALVVGARCAGAATAMLPAREGLDVLVAPA